MDYKAKQKEFKKRLKQSTKLIWQSLIPRKWGRPYGRTYIKAKHGLIGSDKLPT